MDTSILKSKLQQKISHKIVNNLITEAALPLVAGAAAVQAASGLTVAAAANTVWDDTDSDTWKTGGKRAKIQYELTGLGDKGTFAQAWKDVVGGAAVPVRNPKRVEKQVQSEEEARKEQVFKDNPNLKAELEAERQQRAANREQDEHERRERKYEDRRRWNNISMYPKPA